MGKSKRKKKRRSSDFQLFEENAAASQSKHHTPLKLHNRFAELVDVPQTPMKERESDSDHVQPSNTNLRGFTKHSEQQGSGSSSTKFVPEVGMILQGGYKCERITEENDRIQIQVTKESSEDVVYTGEIFHLESTKVGEQERALLKQLAEADPRDNAHLARLEESFTLEGHVFNVLNQGMLMTEALQERMSLSLDDIRFCCLQMLVALTFLSNNGYVHTNFGTQSMFADSKVTLGDVTYYRLGMLRDVVKADQPQTHTKSVECSRKSPEMVFGLGSLTGAFDMWSFGCAVMEIYLGFPLIAVTSDVGLVKRLKELLGEPPQKYLDAKHYKKYYGDDNQLIDIRSPQSGTQRTAQTAQMSTDLTADSRLKKLLSNVDQTFVDFIVSILQYDPEARLKPHEALTHPFLFPTYDPFAVSNDLEERVQAEVARIAEQIQQESDQKNEKIKQEKERAKESMEQAKKQLETTYQKKIADLQVSFAEQRSELEKEFEIERNHMRQQAQDEKWKELEKLKRTEKEKHKLILSEIARLEETYENGIKAEVAKMSAAEDKIANLRATISELKKKITDAKSVDISKDDEKVGKASKRKQDDVIDLDLDDLIHHRAEKKAKTAKKQEPQRSSSKTYAPFELAKLICSQEDDESEDSEPLL